MRHYHLRLATNRTPRHSSAATIYVDQRACNPQENLCPAVVTARVDSCLLPHFFRPQIQAEADVEYPLDEQVGTSPRRVLDGDNVSRPD